MNKRKKKRSKANTKRGTDQERKVPTSGDTSPATKAERLNEKPLKVKNLKSSAGHIAVELQEPNHELGSMKMLQAFGTPDEDLQNFLISQVLQTFDGCHSSKGSCGADILVSFCNQALSILQGIAPRDEVEGLLAVQMIGVHNVALQTMKRAMISDQTFEGKQATVNQATKMLRTFVAQMEALKKYRTGGQQKVTVEHVHVNKGGQAIVGPVHQGGGGKK
jgi:hypothetical protein